MRKLNKVLIALCINLAWFTVSAQTIDQTLVMADSYVNQRNISESIRLYKRALFFSQSDSLTVILHHQLGILYSENNEHENAAEHYLSEATFYEGDDLETTTRLKGAFEYILDGQDSLALTIIDTSWLYNSTKENRYRTLLYSGLANELRGNTETAVSYFSQFYSSINTSDSVELFKLNQELLQCFKKNPNVAKTLSIFIPGSGQLYAGSPKDALNAFMLNGSLIGLFIYTSLSYTWLDGTLAFMQWIPRYYAGSVIHAKKDAEKFNRQKLRNAYQKHLQFFEHVNLK